jgi:opacity protein-like surface antigen
MLRRHLTSSLFAVTLALAAPAAAQITTGGADAIQTQTPKPRPPGPAPAPAQARPGPPRDPVGFRAYVNFDYVAIAAKDSFDAVLGTSTMTGVGGGGEVLNLWKNVFARVGVWSMSDTGTRVAVVDGEVFDLDIPIEVRMRTLEIAGGWRYAHRPRPRPPVPGKPAPPPPPAKPAPPPAKPGAAPARPASPPPPRFAVYGGGGFLNLSYREESQFAGSLENVRDTFTGFVVFGGIDVAVGKWIIAGVEGQYRSISTPASEGGVSQVFGENNLGGAAVRLLIGIRK